MINVYCVFWGAKYPASYVYRLRNAIDHYLAAPHAFHCITSLELDGIHCVKPPCDYPGWWQKIGLFYPGLNIGPALYLDLDTVIVGELDTLVATHTAGGIHMTRNWSASAHGGWQSSVMLWRDDAGRAIWDNFDFDIDSPRLWGDQEFITELLGENVKEIPPGDVVSYKYHCQGGTLPESAKIVCFHGKPDYHEVNDEWALRYIQTRLCPINESGPKL
jgi:hypothetical protein